jgi:hypothetical protein
MTDPIEKTKQESIGERIVHFFATICDILTSSNFGATYRERDGVLAITSLLSGLDRSENRIDKVPDGVGRSF